MISFLLVGTGGFIGSTLRYGISLLMQNNFLTGFPIATLTVNLIGSFLIGIFLAIDKKFLSDNISLLIVTGLIGGFTTFSAFSGEMVLLLKNQQMYYAIFYVLTTLIFGLLLAAFGFYLSRHFLFR